MPLFLGLYKESMEGEVDAIRPTESMWILSSLQE
jgi:hypothetical protein